MVNDSKWSGKSISRYLESYADLVIHEENGIGRLQMYMNMRTVRCSFCPPLELRCGYALAKDLDQVLCNTTRAVYPMCSRLHQCSYINDISIDNHGTKSSPLPLLGKNHQAVESYLLWQLCGESHEEMLKDTARVDAYRTCKIVCHDSDVDCWCLKSLELVCVYHNFPFGSRNWNKTFRLRYQHYQRLGT